MKNNFENSFFGKSAMLQHLKRRVLDLKEGYRQNVALLGNRFLGKSRALQKFIADLDDEAMVVIYLDLDYNDFNYFVSRFISSLLYNFSKMQRLPLFEDSKLLLENAREIIPQTIAAIEKIQSDLRDDNCDQCYQELISLPEIFSNETGKFCVIVLDEFQNLQEFGVSEVFQELGKKIMTQKRSIYIVSSSSPLEARKILSEKLSLLFGNFEVLDMDPLDLTSSQQFIEHHLSGVKIGFQLKGFLADFTLGHPLYLDLILKEIVNLCAIHKQDEVFLPIVTQSIENVLFNPWGVISRHFDLLINQLAFSKNARAMSSVLIALSNGRNKLKELSDQLGLKNAILSQRINCLIDAGVIVKNGNVFHFRDKLLRYWVKYVFQKRLQVIDLDLEHRRKEFVEELSRSWTNFQKVSQENLSSRIVELLSCFENEAFNLNGRKYKLPTFHEILPVFVSEVPDAGFEVLKAIGSEGVWYIILKKENLCENDVNAFLGKLKKINEKPQRRVIISMSELDENTRVKALQERMWIWNEREINSLLNFYDKPFILK